MIRVVNSAENINGTYNDVSEVVIPEGFFLKIISVENGVYSVPNKDKERFLKQKQKEKKPLDVKIVQIAANIDEGDFRRKVADALKFLAKKHPIKVVFKRYKWQLPDEIYARFLTESKIVFTRMDKNDKGNIMAFKEANGKQS